MTSSQPDVGTTSGAKAPYRGTTRSFQDQCQRFPGLGKSKDFLILRTSAETCLERSSKPDTRARPLRRSQSTFMGGRKLYTNTGVGVVVVVAVVVILVVVGGGWWWWSGVGV